MPAFSTPSDREQIEQLMQPALIRTIDNLRKQLDEVNWEGQYEEELIWPEETTNEQKQTYTDLQKQLHGVPTEEHDRVAGLMSELPQPSPLYRLKLTRKGYDAQTLDVWAICYEVCSTNYQADADTPMTADNSLLAQTGDVDWRKLDNKTKSLIEGIFANLPDSPADYSSAE